MAEFPELGFVKRQVIRELLSFGSIDRSTPEAVQPTSPLHSD
jgi:hypothetical protein